MAIQNAAHIFRERLAVNAFPQVVPKDEGRHRFEVAFLIWGHVGHSLNLPSDYAGKSTRSRRYCKKISTRYSATMKHETTVINIRVTLEERAAWKAFAKNRGKPLGRIIKEYVQSAMVRDERKNRGRS